MSDKEKVIDISVLRKEKNEVLRREYERVLFEKILGCYTVLERLGLKQIDVMDISKSGLSFKLESSEALYKVDEEIDIRFYFSNKTYIPVGLKIKRVEESDSRYNKTWLYGCAFDTEMSSYDALKKFVDFIYAYSEAAKRDSGDTTILYF